jgi:hypothetical protein
MAGNAEEEEEELKDLTYLDDVIYDIDVTSGYRRNCDSASAYVILLLSLLRSLSVAF